MGESGTDEAALQRSRSGRRWMALTLVFLSLGGLWLWLDRGRSSTARGAATIDAPATRAADGDERPRASSGVREETRSEDTAATTPASDAPPAASNDELRAALRRLAQTDMQASSALASALRPQLVPPANVLFVCQVFTRHILTVCSRLSFENRRPSGLKATDGTQLVWPDNVLRLWPVWTSHKRTVWS